MMLNKQDLHDRVKNTTTTSEITIDEIIQVYGHDNTAMKNGTSMCIADVLAQVYGMNVDKVDNKYIFTKP